MELSVSAAWCRRAKMGGSGSSTRRVTFEADENENITVVKGVRVRAGLPRAGALRGYGRGLVPPPPELGLLCPSLGS